MNPKNNDKSSEQPNLGATLDFLGSVVVTLGFLIGTIGEGITLQENLEEEQSEKKSKSNQKLQLSQIEKKLDYVINELEALKRKR
ncbi:hypothetical protein MKZ20_01145 [Psychrobacillus sp. FSL K6-2684]|uniref:Holin n=2 Tax=Psychrobacillus TaxID=1221880 RepID=A0ABR8RA55_9BACI|nr:hypothetical protein [Psychrobacillus faecigallinarum]MBD7944686.1 hypothetical protein [Psychrobacillus faecigallinarum]QEY21207.1 hypothetical protein D0S48_11185 [Psychrobacillus sp. AK 1817]QGM31724.1 hypothetical protein GI482_15670 [Bacillus sp. N3536]